ncbi:diguanylate cyclase domain-containing protein [Actinoplanes sp. G11-F43]|uniref:diguanylate cyclase domain-containing protein n=1 Tax=Actinoplanes sp. G11-F43 TaxID=3424130 RepID=UPI003D32B284
MDHAETAHRLAADDQRMADLIRRNLFAEALATGRDALTGQGLTIPDGPPPDPEPRRLSEELIRWAATGSAEEDARRAGDAGPLRDAVGRVLARSVQAAFLGGDPLAPWLIRLAVRLWISEGPAAGLAGALAHVNFVLAGHGDYATGDTILRRLMRFTEILGTEPDLSYTRFLHTVSAAPFTEPFPEAVAAARAVHESLTAAGDPTSAGFTVPGSVPLLLEYGDDLAGYRAETDRGLAFAADTGNEPGRRNLEVHRQLGAILAGDRDDFDESALTGDGGTTVFGDHVMRAVAALILGDEPALFRHAAGAADLIPSVNSLATVVPAHLVRALALAMAGRAGSPEFAAHRDWLDQRAADNPTEFGHLLPWLRAEQARQAGDLTTAVREYDAAQRAADDRRRPWHQAVIAERHGRLLLAHGVTHTARLLLADAAGRYRRWGAERKVADLRAEFGVEPGEGPAGAPVPDVDLLAVLRAGQTISSAAGLAALAHRTGEALTALTGASTVHLVLQDGGPRLLTGGGGLLPLDDPAARELLPLTAIRYADRTRETLAVADATRDDRFAADPYLTALPRCALLVTPVGDGALLVLENRHTRGAFSTPRRDTVALLTGQIGVSLRNALTHAALERKVADRTRELATANARLAEQVGTDVLTGLPNRRRLASADGATAAAMIDIDHFTRYNDHYGHLAGDACLREVAQAISGAIRSGDIVIRYGGAEFAVLLADADEPIARMVAERIQAAIRRLGLPHAAAPAGVVTASIGVACSGTGHQELIRAADESLYESKRDGRDRITVGGTPG